MCNCGWGCPCRVSGARSQDRCEALVAARILDGRYGDVALDGLVFVAAWWWPGAIHEGRGLLQPAIDARADDAQRAALLEIVTGRAGGMPFEIFAQPSPHHCPPSWPRSPSTRSQPRVGSRCRCLVSAASRLPLSSQARPRMASVFRSVAASSTWSPNSDRKSTRLNSSHTDISRMPSSA